MKMPDVGGLVARYKVPILGAGAAVAVVAALARKRGGASSDSARVYPASTGAYDSTANDVYNSMWPQIEALQRSIEELRPSSPSQAVNPGRLPRGRPEHQPPPPRPVRPPKPVRIPKPPRSSRGPDKPVHILNPGS